MSWRPARSAAGFAADPDGALKSRCLCGPRQAVRGRLRALDRLTAVPGGPHLLVSGSTRAHSTNTAALRAARDAAPPGVSADALRRSLRICPPSTPTTRSTGPRTRPSPRLREQFAAADGVLFCMPEYAGTLPGSLKNLLDWTVGHGDLYEKPSRVVERRRARGAAMARRPRCGRVLEYVTATIVADAMCEGRPSPAASSGRTASSPITRCAARLGEIPATLAEAIRDPRILNGR